MARNQNTFEKMRREMEKRRKAELKRARRQERKDNAGRQEGDEPAGEDEQLQEETP